jgi:hypothetical protein
MTDPNDFTVPLQDLVRSLEDSIKYGVEQPATLAFNYQPAKTNYELPSAAVDITRVTGFVDGGFIVFEKSREYRFASNPSRIEWLTEQAPSQATATTPADEGAPKNFPDEASRFEVEYTYRDLPSGLTDFTPGSVVGTLLRAVAREMALLYNQMDQAYRRAFIDQADGAALDNVVALLGVARNQAQKAKGTATFYLKKATDVPVNVPLGTRVADVAGHVFVTTEAGTILSGAVEEIVADRRVKFWVAELLGVWLEDTASPTTENSLKAAVDKDQRTIIPAANAPALPVGRLRVRYKPKSVTVPIEALEPGPESNVNAGTITIMPTPPPKIQGVTNAERTQGGLKAENDERLRERAKHELEREGDATLDALKYSVLDVDGVQGVEVLDHHGDDSIPLGEVRVRYFGGDHNQVLEAIERTRAAGIMVRADKIDVVYISGTFYLLPATHVPAGALVNFIQAVREAMLALPIGAPLSVRRLNALAFNIPGIADVAEAKLQYPVSATEKKNIINEPFAVARNQLVRPADLLDLKASMLVKLKWAAARKATGVNAYMIDIQILDASDKAVEFRDFSIELSVTLRATLLLTPNQPQERIGDEFKRTVRFAASATAQLAIQPADLSGFNATRHKPEVKFVITAPAYPGLGKIEQDFNVTS